MAEPNVEVLPSPFSVIGEGPHWDVDTQSLYYNDIYGNQASILRYDLKQNRTYSAVVEGEPVVSFVIPVEGTKDQFAIGIGRRVGVVQWDGVSSTVKVLRIALEVEKDASFKFNRFNDAKSDPKGRFFGGTMRLEECGDLFGSSSGSLYSLAEGEEVKVLKTNVSVSNGLAWNEQKKKFYYIDTCQLDVKEFDYDPDTGNISNERVLIDFKKNGDRPGYLPDGMTIDADGNLYVATWGGSRIIKVNGQSGKVEQEIKLPAEQVTSVAFGGPNLDILFATTAAIERAGPQPKPAGALFKITGLGVKGLPGVKVRV